MGCKHLQKTIFSKDVVPRLFSKLRYESIPSSCSSLLFVVFFHFPHLSSFCLAEVVAVRRAGVMPWAGVGVTRGAVWRGTVEELGECGGGLRSRMDSRGAQSTSFLADGVGWTSVGVLSFGRGGVGQRSWARRHGKEHRQLRTRR